MSLVNRTESSFGDMDQDLDEIDEDDMDKNDELQKIRSKVASY